MKLVEKILIAVGLYTTVKVVYKTGETVGEFKGACREVKQIHKEFREQMKNRD